MSKMCFGIIKAIITKESIKTKMVKILNIPLFASKNTLPKISVNKETKNIQEKKVTTLSGVEKYAKLFL